MHAAKAALCHHCDVKQLCDVIGHVIIRLSIDDFLYALNRNQTCISLSFHDVILDVITIRVDIIDTQHRETIMLKDRLIPTRTLGEEAFQRL